MLGMMKPSMIKSTFGKMLEGIAKKYDMDLRDVEIKLYIKGTDETTGKKKDKIVLDDVVLELFDRKKNQRIEEIMNIDKNIN